MITAVTYYLLECDDCGEACEGTEGYELLFATPKEARRAAADGEDGWILADHGRALCRHCHRARFCRAVGHLWQLPRDARDPIACRRCPARTARADAATSERPVLLRPMVLQPPHRFAENEVGAPPPF